MAVPNLPKTVTFGGFDKKDVLMLVDGLNQNIQELHNENEYLRTRLHKSMRTSFRQILLQTALKCLPGDSPPAHFCLVCDKIMLENPHTYLMKTNSEKEACRSR